MVNSEKSEFLIFVAFIVLVVGTFVFGQLSFEDAAVFLLAAIAFTTHEVPENE